jgi:signal peptidase I
LGFLRPFRVPTGAMTPTLSRGDHFMMEGFTFRARAPRRGDVVVFKTDGIDRLPGGMIYNKRVAGLPGDALRISDGSLYVNDTHVRLENAAGDIRYVFLPGSIHLTSHADTVTVPKGHYFVLADDSLRSSDSRFYGFVPAEDILGRASFRFWPPNRIGWVK